MWYFPLRPLRREQDITKITDIFKEWTITISQVYSDLRILETIHRFFAGDFLISGKVANHKNREKRTFLLNKWI